MAEVDLASLPDGAVLRTLDSGLQIIRRKKHEWNVALRKLNEAKLAVRTN